MPPAAPEPAGDVPLLTDRHDAPPQAPAAAGISPAELARRTGDMAALAEVRPITYAEGAERGVRALQFRTGSGLAFDVLADRGLDIGPAEHAGHSFGWRSATGFRHPGLHENADEDGMGWLRSFSGLLVTGGLDHTFAPAEHPVPGYRHPGRPRVRHPLHGRVANLPARMRSSGAEWRDGRYVLWAEGEVRQAAVFGENLLLLRRIEAYAGRDDIVIDDEVRNDGFEPAPHRMLYHLNFGWPLLDEGTRLVTGPITTVWESDSCAEQGTAFDRFPAPVTGFVEEVRHHVPVPGPGGTAEVALVNDRLELGVSLAWETGTLPHLVQWSHLRAGGYAVGLEPSTHHPLSPAGDPADLLAPGDRRRYRLRLRVTRGTAALAALTAGITAAPPPPHGTGPARHPAGTAG